MPSEVLPFESNTGWGRGYCDSGGSRADHCTSAP
jgi:hypothetical protein